MRARLILASLMFGLATPLQADDFARPAMVAPLPQTLLGNDCMQNSLEDAEVVICMADDLMSKPTVGVTLAPVSRPMSFGDLKRHTRDTFHDSQIRKVVREKRIKLEHAPDAVALEGVYSTNMGLRRVWVAYHDGVLIRVLVSALSKEADGDYRDEIMSAVFGPERFASAAIDEKVSNDE